jgi:hypothetical protein
MSAPSIRLAEDVARELPNLPLEDLLQLVHLYAERGSPEYEKGGDALASAVPHGACERVGQACGR